MKLKNTSKANGTKVKRMKGKMTVGEKGDFTKFNKRWARLQRNI